MFAENSNGSLVCRHLGETIRIEPWGSDSLRIRVTRYPSFSGENWALSEEIPHSSAKIAIGNSECSTSSIQNGRIRADINEAGIITFFRDDHKVLREYFRNYDGTISRESRCLKALSREWHPLVGGDYRVEEKFEANPDEKIFGMGQYQQPNTNLKGTILDMEQRNSQITVPFMISSLNYGLLWNNPAIGRASFGTNITEFRAEACKEIDYWITVGENPKELLQKYSAATGTAPEYPSDMTGLWQCKLRYRTQEEVLQVARDCKAHQVPIDVIVIDYFHWTYQGDWKFDSKYWPNPKAMIDELHSMGIKVVVSVWPSVDKRSENFNEMNEKGLLIRTERGGAQTYDYLGDCVEYDATNPEAREFVWNKCKQNYYDLGVDNFWLDNSEPDYVTYDFDHYRYALGPALECSNIWPQYFSRTFYDNETAMGKQPVNLLRSCWAGSQKYGNVIWSGDVPSTFEAFRDQLQAGLNMGLAGIPWWTTDIGGFMTDDVSDPAFQQLLIRWYEFAVFTAVFRMHGDRGPYTIPNLDDRDFGGGCQHTGQPNELWSYGEDNYKIMKKYLNIRLEMKPYIEKLFHEAHTDGSPLVRTMFYEFPDDDKCWNTYDQYMFGDEYLVAPILTQDTWEREVYLPKGTWKDTRDGKIYEGGTSIKAAAPLDSIPVYHLEKQ
jgi:alpha-D-xyloside xylohydrolase